MTNRIARRFAASVAFAALSLATPALAHGSLLVRTMGKLYRLEQKAGSAK